MSDGQTSPGFFKKIFGGRVEETPEVIADHHQTQMMDAAEQFQLLRVVDVMVPRADIIATETSAGLHDLAKTFKEAGHSRLPVYKDTLDNPSGMVHIKDVLHYLMLDAKGRSGKTYPARKIIQYIRRPVLYVPPSMRAMDLMRRMQARRIHMAIVVDEYGGTDGIVTLEDLVEQIVGKIEDEHDGANPESVSKIKINGLTMWEADARIMIDDLEIAIGREFATEDEEGEVDTLGGLVFTLAGRVPERGEVIKHPDGVEFEVIDADPRRVKRLRVQLTQPKATVVTAPASGATDAKAETGAETKKRKRRSTKSDANNPETTQSDSAKPNPAASDPS